MAWEVYSMTLWTDISGSDQFLTFLGTLFTTQGTAWVGTWKGQDAAFFTP